ncbi:MAG: 2-phosphosulfolactate phosphatase [Marmoricola sp.]
MTHPAHRQSGSAVRFEWGATGADAVREDTDVVVVVDVLSFTTTTTIALEAGATVVPWPWKDASAAAAARARGAVLAVGRREGREKGSVSLSPAAMRRAARPGSEVLLPSPNGATLANRLAAAGAACVAGCLRNATAVGRWVADRGAGRVAVIAAGERWTDGTLRPAVEDLWGAGAVLDALARRDRALTLSVEAQTARDAFRAVAATLPDALLGCASGLELVGSGFAEDVRIAAERDASSVVPLLQGDTFVAAGR